MDWISTETRMPNTDLDGFRVETFSPSYPKDSAMRHRIMDAKFVKVCKEVTHWRKLEDPFAYPSKPKSTKQTTNWVKKRYKHTNV